MKQTGIMWFSVRVHILSLSGTMSVTNLVNLLSIADPTPASKRVVLEVCRSPLKYHVCVFLDSLVFWLMCLSCSASSFMSCSFIHDSISSLFASCFIPLTFRVAMLMLLNAGFLSACVVRSGSWACPASSVVLRVCALLELRVLIRLFLLASLLFCALFSARLSMAIRLLSPLFVLR